ncbi:MAG: hypothetical protein KFB96_23265 [Thiocapsa sp.]|uniref:hypothetical protein n=1 Tax=Thiocapsa sp. TaxID=2024551 RepID=UPI001BCE50F1|nr:hypothetical protein [Thiocapsa sp.]QVL48483.1 MAG: hypothetical protein KFB96_23265 [Thiocapsa sp.]
MNGEPFVDTNIRVYAHLETPRDPKGDLARALVESDPRFVVSTRVLNEYYAAMLKNRVSDLWHDQCIEGRLIVRNPFKGIN